MLVRMWGKRMVMHRCREWKLEPPLPKMVWRLFRHLKMQPPDGLAVSLLEYVSEETRSLSEKMSSSPCSLWRHSR